MRKNIGLEFYSFILLLLWTISPVIEYILKIYNRRLYTHYFTSMIYIIGFLGIVFYIYSFIKSKEKFSIRKYIPEILLIILLIISIISTLMCESPHYSFWGGSYRKEGLLVYIMYIGFILMASRIKNDKYIKYLINSIIISAIVITILPLFKDDFTYLEFTNIFHNSNHYGYYLMINTMLTLCMFINSNKLFKKIIYILIYIFFLYLLIRNDTFGSYLAIITTLLFLLIYSLIKKYKILDIIIVILVFIGTSFVVSNYDIKIGERIHFDDKKGIVSNNFFLLKKDIEDITDKDGNISEEAGSYRIILWQEAWKYTLDHPWIGGGMEALRFYYISDKGVFYSKYNDRPHNVTLQVSTFIGIPGAIIYLTFIIYIAISNLMIMKRDSIHIMIYSTAMCYFLSSLLGNSMYYTSPYFMVLLGLLIGFNKRKLTKS